MNIEQIKQKYAIQYPANNTRKAHRKIFAAILVGIAIWLIW